MLHKIRIAMGKRDEGYQLSDLMELDQGFFTASASDDNSSNNQGGQKHKVMVIAQVKQVDHQSVTKHKPNKEVSFIKMIHVYDMKKEYIKV